MTFSPVVKNFTLKVMISNPIFNIYLFHSSSFFLSSKWSRNCLKFSTCFSLLNLQITTMLAALKNMC